MSKWQRLGAQALLAAPGAWFLFDWAKSPFRSPVEALVGAGILTGAALLGWRHVVAQVLGRGVAWALFAPCAIGFALEATRGRPDLGPIAIGGAAFAALILARPMLETSELKAAFAPIAQRGALLFSASAAVAASLLLAVLALLVRSPYASALPIGIEAAALLASGMGVARMRAWGILLGAATAVAAPFVAGSLHAFTFVQAILAIGVALPGISMVAAIAAARARAVVTPPLLDRGARVAVTPMRARVADLDDDDLTSIDAASSTAGVGARAGA